jgi:PAS domain S-box-containing protein
MAHAGGQATQGRIWLVAMAAMALALLMLLSAGLMLAQRSASLDRAEAQAKREVLRLATELDQSLRLARAVIEVAERSPDQPSGDLLDDHRPLVESLNLPFELERVAGLDGPAGPAGEWLPGLPRQAGGAWVVPLVWRQKSGDDGAVYEVRLSRQALLDRFASDGMPAGSSMSLFRLEDDGATTVLTRHPLVEHEQGMSLRGHLASAVAQRPAGVFHATAQIDGIHRIVGYQQMPGEAHRLMLVYALGTQGVLSDWATLLPWAGLLTLLVGATMAWGAWRLDRSVVALRRSERHFQTLASHLPDVVTRYDRDGRCLYVNPAIESANGLKPEDMIGRTVRDIGTPEPIANTWMACLDRVFSTGQSETVCFSYPGPHGLRHWEAQARLEPALPGEAPTVLVLTRDITERQAAEQQRESAQRLFESVFQSAPEAMSLSEPETGRLLLVNDAFCELFGRSRDEMIGRTSSELGLCKSPIHRQSMLHELRTSGTVRDAEEIGVRSDGRTIDVRFSAELVRVNGEDRVLLMFRDVSERKQAEEALARSELRFRLAASRGQVWEWDFDNGDFSPSHEFFVQLGHPVAPKARLDQIFGEIVHPEDLPRLRWQMHRFLKGESGFHAEFRARDASGAWHWFDAQGNGLRDASGRVSYMAGTAFDISDRKALEEAQRQTLKHLETVTDASSALFWTSDVNQGCTWVSQRWLDMLGQTLEQQMGDGWRQNIHPDDLEQCGLIYAEAFDQREPYTTEYRERNAQGEYRWLLEQGTPRYDADNRFIGYIGSCLDITELKQAQATARERGAMLEQVFDVLQDMLFVLDGQERFVFYQSGREDRLYLKPDEFLGKAMSEVMPADLTGRFREAMDLAWTAGMQEIDYQLDLPDGRHHFNARLAWLAGGDQCMFLVRDTTEQQIAQRERERLNEFVLLLFSLANRFINLPVHEADRAINEALGDMGRFVDADRAYLFNYDMEAETASNTHEWCGEGVSPEIDNLQNLPFAMIPDWIGFHRIDQVMHVADVSALEPGNLRELLSAQGIQSLMAIPLSHGDRCLGFVGLDSVRSTHDYGEEETTLLRLFAQMLVNIRLRVEAEEKIRALTEGLEAKVAERTTQLETSVRQLQAVNRELESFTYSASHDLRTPLRGIEGFSALLLEEHATRLDAQGREYLQRIQRATMHMSQLISDLLAYARLEQMTEQVTPVPLESVVRNVLGSVQDTLDERQGQVVIDVPSGLQVAADPRGLTMVLRNLIDNAVKFTPAERPPRVRIQARVQDGLVHIEVADNGMGFDMKHHDRIFGMFQRLHRQDQIPGTGIGLAMVNKAVTRMGGRIRAESAPGEGARFHITLATAG